MANTIESVRITNPFGKTDTAAKISVAEQDYLCFSAVQEAGEHTLCSWIKSDSTKLITFIQNEQREFNVGSDWTRIVWTFAADVSDILALLPAGTYYFYNTKIEMGNIATDYTRAPEDTEKEITELVTKYSDVTQTVDKISSTVGKHTTEIDDLGIKVTSTETVATQTADKFNWLVDSGTSAVDFTITDRLANLTAQYINLNGLVTFSALDSATQDKINGGIDKIDVMYAQSDSNTTAPAIGWSTTAPQWVSGMYMWQKTVTTYKDGTSAETSATVLTGAKGADGKDGTSVTILGSYDTVNDLIAAHQTGDVGDGYMVAGDLYVWNATSEEWQNVGQIKGDAGVGVSAVMEEYYLSTSAAGQVGGAWTEDEPAWVIGSYIWTRSKINYDNDTVSYTTPVLAKAINSANSTANSALTAANTANTTATNASSIAAQADTNASSALTQATVALNVANNAVDNAIESILGAGKEFSANDNLNDFINVGAYSSEDTDVVQSLKNGPDGISNAGEARLVVEYVGSATYLKQTLTLTMAGKRNYYTYYRTGNSSGNWSVWESSDMLLANLCYDSNKTYIDGGKIYTGTVTAVQIAANAITADKIASNAIMSKNYIGDTSGSFLNLADGSFDSKYLKWDSQGNAKMTSGLVGGWHITDAAIWARTSDDKYTAYIQNPEYVVGATQSEAWVFSAQEGTVGNWYVQADGYMRANKGADFYNSVGFNGNVTFAADAVFNTGARFVGETVFSDTAHFYEGISGIKFHTIDVITSSNGNASLQLTETYRVLSAWCLLSSGAAAAVLMPYFDATTNKWAVRAVWDTTGEVIANTSIIVYCISITNSLIGEYV